jgi:hypothetical protein
VGTTPRALEAAGVEPPELAARMAAAMA